MPDNTFLGGDQVAARPWLSAASLADDNPASTYLFVGSGFVWFQQNCSQPNKRIRGDRKTDGFISLVRLVEMTNSCQ
jgi:hypothetical protein